MCVWGCGCVARLQIAVQENLYMYSHLVVMLNITTLERQDLLLFNIIQKWITF